MREQILQAWKVYLTAISWRTGLMLAGLMVFEAAFVSVYLLSDNTSQPNIVMQVLPGFYLAAWIIHIAKAQFANFRAKLIPNFHGPHLVVLAVQLCIVLILNPLILALASGANGLSAVTLSVALSAAFCLGSQGGPLPYIMAPVFWFSLTTKSGQDFWNNVSQNTWLQCLILLAGLLVTGLRLRALTNIDEEMSDYQTDRPLEEQIDKGEKRRILGRAAKQKSLVQVISDRWHDRLPLPGITIFQKFKLLHYGFGRLPFGIVCMFCILILTVFAASITRDYDRTDFSEFTLMSLAQLLPLAAVAPLASRNEWAAQEQLLPLTRTERIGLLLAIGAKNAFLLWIICIGTVTLAVIRGNLNESENLSSYVFAFVCLSAALQLPTIGFGLLLALNREVPIMLVGLLVLTIGNLFVLLTWWDDVHLSPNWNTVLGLSAILVPLGLFLVIGARQRWLNAEV
jgi:hypothetical protein